MFFCLFVRRDPPSLLPGRNLSYLRFDPSFKATPRRRRGVTCMGMGMGMGFSALDLANRSSVLINTGLNF
jgi:hypothetical protein